MQDPRVRWVLGIVTEVGMQILNVSIAYNKYARTIIRRKDYKYMQASVSYMELFNSLFPDEIHVERIGYGQVRRALLPNEGRQAYKILRMQSTLLYKYWLVIQRLIINSLLS